MGNFATIGTYGSKNLTHILLDNEVHDSTGGQPTVSAGIKFAQIAQACGYEISYEGNEPLILEKILPKKSQYKPKFVHLKIARGTIDNLPRPNISPEQLLQRLLQHIKSI
jgi:phosphonopyruvate decarboxylase